MSALGSVTFWLQQLEAGDPVAAQKLWEGYFQRLVGLARKKLQSIPRAAADEEDVALSAFKSFCQGAEAGRFPQLLDRDDLWQLLMVLTARKATDLFRHELRQKRGGGKVGRQSALASGTSAAADSDLANLIGREPDPEFAAQVAEQCQYLLDRLSDDQLRAIAVGKMEGYTNEEIADRLGKSLATVERKLRLIRKLWEKEDTP